MKKVGVIKYKLKLLELFEAKVTRNIIKTLYKGI